ncbi:30S ribosomal protein S13 [Mycolicibacterium monacense DSM 44395]|nr:30S ribosomal protein S13 [Mycolicibacterium monacense DSM 44395]
MHAHRRGVVGDADRQIGHRSAERIQRQHGDLAHPRRGIRLVDASGGAQRQVGAVHIRRTAHERLGADPPEAEQHRRGLPVRGKQDRHPARRARPEFVAKQVAGLGRPVRQRHVGHFDAFAGRVVVVGDARPGGVGIQQRAQQCRGDSQFTHSGSSEPAVMICGGGGGAAGSVAPVATGSAASSVGSVPSSPEPGPV